MIITHPHHFFQILSEKQQINFHGLYIYQLEALMSLYLLANENNGSYEYSYISNSTSCIEYCTQCNLRGFFTLMHIIVSTTYEVQYF